MTAAQRRLLILLAQLVFRHLSLTPDEKTAIRRSVAAVEEE